MDQDLDVSMVVVMINHYVVMEVNCSRMVMRVEKIYSKKMKVVVKCNNMSLEMTTTTYL